MTTKANPSVSRASKSHETSVTIAEGGGLTPGYVVPSSDTKLGDEDSDLNDANFNAFSESHSASSFDVTIDAGEAFVHGRWVAIDTSTTVTLSSSTNNQTVFVGWSKSTTDGVTVGLSGDFASDDRKMAVWEFDTDGSGVTAARDQRYLGRVDRLDDGQKQFLGGDDDTSVSFDSSIGSNGAAKIRDEVNGSDLVAALVGGGVHLKTDTFIESPQALVIGDTEREKDFTSDGDRLQILGDDFNAAGVTIINYSSNSTQGISRFAKTRSGTINTTNAAVQDGDGIHRFIFHGDDGGGFVSGTTAAVIDVVVDGPVSSDTVPGRVEIHTTTTGGTATKALEINSSQELDLVDNLLVGLSTGSGSSPPTTSSEGELRLFDDTDVSTGGRIKAHVNGTDYRWDADAGHTYKDEPAWHAYHNPDEEIDGLVDETRCYVTGERFEQGDMMLQVVDDVVEKDHWNEVHAVPVSLDAALRESALVGALRERIRALEDRLDDYAA